jgi:hypothetical protein
MQPVLAARSPPIEPSNPNEPLQRRLALTGDNRWVWGVQLLQQHAGFVRRLLWHRGWILASLPESGMVIREGA